MTQLIAKSPVFYAGRTRRKGEVFSALPAHASLLLKTSKVSLYEGSADAPAVVDPPPRARRQYRRRDLRAEG